MQGSKYSSKINIMLTEEWTDPTTLAEQRNILGTVTSVSSSFCEQRDFIRLER